MTNKQETEPQSQEPQEVLENQEAEENALDNSLAEITAERDELKDRLLRQAAEMENFKKRSQREKVDFLKRANESMAKDLLPVLDNLERALEHTEEAENSKSFIEGLGLIHKDFLKVLTQNGLEAIESLNQPFNPEYHQAMMQEEDDTVEENTVIKELQKGYLFQERLIRPSMVVVSKKPAKNEDHEGKIEIKVK